MAGEGGDPYGELKYIEKLHFGDIEYCCYRVVAVVER